MFEFQVPSLIIFWVIVLTNTQTDTRTDRHTHTQTHADEYSMFFAQRTDHFLNVPLSRLLCLRVLYTVVIQ